MKELVYNRKQNKILVPETWKEITARQFLQIAGLLHAEGYDELKQMDRLLKIVCNVSLYRFLMIPVEVRMNAYEHVAWLLEPKAIGTEQKIISYKGLYGPESGFNNLSISEFNHSESAYSALVNDGDTDALDELVAVLYREPKNGYDKKRNPEGDIRKPYAFTEVSWHKKKVVKWKNQVKLAIFLWYDACRQAMFEDHKPAFTGGKASSSYYDGLYPMIRSLAGDKYGPFEQVEKMSVIVALMEIVSSKQEEAELKNKYPELYK